jgi:hypothetical protein
LLPVGVVAYVVGLILVSVNLASLPQVTDDRPLGHNASVSTSVTVAASAADSDDDDGDVDRGAVALLMLTAAGSLTLAGGVALLDRARVTWPDGATAFVPTVPARRQDSSDTAV